MRRLFSHEFRQTDRHVPHLRLSFEEGEEVLRREIVQEFERIAEGGASPVRGD